MFRRERCYNSECCRGLLLDKGNALLGLFLDLKGGTFEVLQTGRQVPVGHVELAFAANSADLIDRKLRLLKCFVE